VKAETLDRYHAADAPPARAGEGDGVLSLRVVDAATDRPVKAAVVLWRLDVPEDDAWTAGDVRLASVDVGEAPFRFEGLPPGRYRAEVPGRRKDAADPPAFDVRRGENERTVAVTMPGSFRAWVRLFDEEGHEVGAAERWSGMLSWYDRPLTPEWAHPRTSRSPGRQTGLGGGCSWIVSRNPAAPWVEIPREPSGCSLGSFPESSAGRAPAWRVAVRPASSTAESVGPAILRPGAPCPECEGVTAEVVVEGDWMADTILVAPAPSRTALLRGFEPPSWVPEARRGEEPGVRATCEAAVLVAGADPDLWRRIPISIEVRLGDLPVGKGTLRCEGPDAAPVWAEVAESPAPDER